jgi:hypothetical protein
MGLSIVMGIEVHPEDSRRKWAIVLALSQVVECLACGWYSVMNESSRNSWKNKIEIEQRVHKEGSGSPSFIHSYFFPVCLLDSTEQKKKISVFIDLRGLFSSKGDRE